MVARQAQRYGIHNRNQSHNKHYYILYHSTHKIYKWNLSEPDVCSMRVIHIMWPCPSRLIWYIWYLSPWPNWVMLTSPRCRQHVHLSGFNHNVLRRSTWWRHQMETFPRNWPFVKRNHLWSPVELWSFPWSAPKQTVERTNLTPVIWDAIAHILTSL